jgi:Cu/Ag efflux protein CusF
MIFSISKSKPIIKSLMIKNGDVTSLAFKNRWSMIINQPLNYYKKVKKIDSTAKKITINDHLVHTPSLK